MMIGESDHGIRPAGTTGETVRHRDTDGDGVTLPSPQGFAVTSIVAVTVAVGMVSGCGRGAVPRSFVVHAGSNYGDALREPGVNALGDARADRRNSGYDAAPIGAVDPATSRSLMVFCEALSGVIDLDGKIRAAYETNRPEAAHDDLHAIGFLLQQLPHRAGAAGAGIDRAAVERSAGVLFNAFSRIDSQLHGGVGSTYMDESKGIAKELSAFHAFLVNHRR